MPARPKKHRDMGCEWHYKNIDLLFKTVSFYIHGPMSQCHRQGNHQGPSTEEPQGSLIP